MMNEDKINNNKLFYICTYLKEETFYRVMEWQNGEKQESAVIKVCDDALIYMF